MTPHVQDRLTRRHSLALIGGALASGSWSVFGHAQSSYPERPVRLVMPAGPGGASAMIGLTYAKTHPADGYTLAAASTSGMAANPYLYKKLTYDPDDFSIVAVHGTYPFLVLVIRTTKPGRNRWVLSQ